jgi:hypothetical protein
MRFESGVTDVARQPSGCRATVLFVGLLVTAFSLPALSQTNMLTNSNFTSNTTGWTNLNTSPCVSWGAWDAATASAKITVTTVGTQRWHQKFFQGVPLVIGQTYNWSFKARSATANRDLDFVIERKDGDYFKAVDTKKTLTTSWQTYSGTFTLSAPTGTLTFNFSFFGGLSTQSYYVDDCVLSIAGSSYTLTTVTTGTGSGTVGLNPALASYASGAIVTVTATPAAGSNFTGWSGSLTGTTNPTTITMDANKSVTAAFTLKTFTISSSAGANGVISPSGSMAVNYGASQTFAITAGSGYAVDVVMVDGASQGSITSYTFNNVIAAHTISATFKIAPPDVVNNSDKLAFSGELFDATGQAIGYPAPVTIGLLVELYTSVTGGVKVYTETFPAVTVSDGYFTVRLGEGTTANKIVDVINANNNMWAQLTVNDGTPNVLSPRTPVTASAYSLAAARVLKGTADPTPSAPSAAIGAYYVNTAASPNTTWVRTQTGWTKLN